MVTLLGTKTNLFCFSGFKASNLLSSQTETCAAMIHRSTLLVIPWRRHYRCRALSVPENLRYRQLGIPKFQNISEDWIHELSISSNNPLQIGIRCGSLEHIPSSLFLWGFTSGFCSKTCREMLASWTNFRTPTGSKDPEIGTRLLNNWPRGPERQGRSTAQHLEPCVGNESCDFLGCHSFFDWRTGDVEYKACTYNTPYELGFFLGSC